MRCGTILLACATMIALAISFSLVALAPIAHAAGERPSVDEVSQGLTCQCGCGLTVANCNHPTCSFSVPIREQIDGMLRRGMGRDVIVASFRRKYGEKILSAPTMQGFNILAWLMPFIAIVVGGGLIALMIERWRRATPTLPSGPEAVAHQVALADPKLRAQLEAEVREKM